MAAQKNNDVEIMTRSGYEKLKTELTLLRTDMRLEVANKLEEAKALNVEKRTRAELEKNSVAVSSLLTSLKILMGIDIDRALKVRSGDVDTLLREKKAADVFAVHSWEPVWEQSPETRIHRTSRELAKGNVKLARARYLPDFSMEMFTANPIETYATYSSKDEVFVSLVWSLPLLDWGERSRGVDQSHLEVVRTSQRLKQARLQFSAAWKNSWQNLKMAEADVELAGEELEAARMEEQKALLEYRGGRAAYPSVIISGEARVRAEMALDQALLARRLLELSSWFLSGGFRRDFLAPDASVRSGEKKMREDFQ